MSDPSKKINTVFKHLSFLSVHRSYNFKMQAIFLHGFICGEMVYEYLQPKEEARGTKLKSSFMSHFNSDVMSPESCISNESHMSHATSILRIFLVIICLVSK